MINLRQTGPAVAKVAASVLGGRASVSSYYDEDETSEVDVLVAENAPKEGLSSYSTVSLHATENLLDSRDVRVELLGVCSILRSDFANLIATAAFCIIKDGWLCAPGVVFPDLLRMSGLSSPLSHIVWIPPFAWEELSSVQIVGDLTVHWLLALPIYESERQLLRDEGFDEFERRFELAAVEVHDLDRPPIVA
jgi:hypothetical protein